jgi:1-deoxy-D-xylulose-5-phosphate reductoisomerase
VPAAVHAPRASETGATVLPVDSEHNALFQAMTAGRREDVTKVIITGLRRPVPHLVEGRHPRRRRLQAALKHPNWSMGRRSRSTSAT